MSPPYFVLDTFFKIAYGAVGFGCKIQKKLSESINGAIQPQAQGPSQRDEKEQIAFEMLQKIRLEQEKMQKKLDVMAEKFSNDKRTNL